MEHRVSKILLSLALSGALLGCARRTAVTLAPGAQALAGASITVIRPDPDPANVQGQLERLLLLRGFRVVSDAAGSNRIEAEARSSRDSTGTTTSASAGRVQRVHSQYALRYRYATRSALGTNDVFESFTATIMNLANGAIVVAADFTQGGLTGKQVGTVLKEFLDQLPQPKQ